MNQSKSFFFNVDCVQSFVTVLESWLMPPLFFTLLPLMSTVASQELLTDTFAGSAALGTGASVTSFAPCSSPYGKVSILIGHPEQAWKGGRLPRNLPPFN